MAESKGQIVVLVALAGVLGGIAWLVLHRSGPKSLPQPTAAALSQQVHIDVYLDGSGSMKNFLEAKPKETSENYLREFLDNCEDALHAAPTTGGWLKQPLRFWKFGSKVSAIPDQGGLRHLADNPEGYRVKGKLEIAGFTENRTSIELPIYDNPQVAEQTSDPEVKVIITDLYQSNGTNVRPSEGLADQYLKDAGAVAIYGIRNPYSVTAPVEDLPALNGASLPPGAADTMPFYIIIAGDNAADVFHTQETLMHGATGQTLKSAFEDQLALALYFSKEPGWRADSEVDGNSTRVDWADSRDLHKRIGTGDFDAHPHAPVGLLRIRDGSGRVTFSTPKKVLALSSAQSGIEPGPAMTIGEGLKVRVKAYVGGARGARVEDKGAERAVEAEPCSMDQAICAAFNGNHLSSKRGPYLFEFDLVAGRPSEQLTSGSKFMYAWNIEDAEELQMAAGGARAAFPRIRNIGGEHPGRTPRLAEFLQVLQGRVFQVKSQETDPVRIATYDLYVEAR